MKKFIVIFILSLIFFYGGWKIKLAYFVIGFLILKFTHFNPRFSEEDFRLYFGLPGCGKTTALTYMFQLYKDKYDVFTNVPLDGAYKLERSDFGRFDMHVEHEQSVVLEDEASVEYFKREFSKFTNEENSFHSQHRHYKVMECFFCQTWDGIDLRLRELNSHLYYIYKKEYPIIGKVIFVRRIAKAFDIIDGDPKDSYVFAPLSTRWFLAKPVFRYFDTYAAPILPKKRWKKYEIKKNDPDPE